jgi:hypothetical protein
MKRHRLDTKTNPKTHSTDDGFNRETPKRDRHHHHPPATRTTTEATLTSSTNEERSIKKNRTAFNTKSPKVRTRERKRGYLPTLLPSFHSPFTPPYLQVQSLSPPLTSSYPRPSSLEPALRNSHEASNQAHEQRMSCLQEEFPLQLDGRIEDRHGQ